MTSEYLHVDADNFKVAKQLYLDCLHPLTLLVYLVKIFEHRIIRIAVHLGIIMHVAMRSYYYTKINVIIFRYTIPATRDLQGN